MQYRDLCRIGIDTGKRVSYDLAMRYRDVCNGGQSGLGRSPKENGPMRQHGAIFRQHTVIDRAGCRASEVILRPMTASVKIANITLRSSKVALGEALYPAIAFGKRFVVG